MAGSNSCGPVADPDSGSIKWQVRPMRNEDIQKCLEIWLQVELCEGEQTVASALASDPGGFYVAELTSTGEVIGMCAGILTREDTAFMGFYAVEPKYQGIGVGRELWATTIKRLDETTNIGLYGVPAMSEKYKKSGLKVEDTIRMLIFESKPGQALELESLFSFDNLKLDYTNESLELLPIDGRTDESIFQKVIAYDQNVNKFCREKLLRNYLLPDSGAPLTLALIRRKPRLMDSACCQADNAVSKVGCSSADDDSKLCCRVNNSLTLASNDQRESSTNSQVEILGYGCIRHDNTNGAMVGPIYADSGEICEVILRSLLERFELPVSGKYSIMSLTSNKEAHDILRRSGLQEMDQCSRMFTKFVPEASYSKIFYVHSPNFSLF